MFRPLLSGRLCKPRQSIDIHLLSRGLDVPAFSLTLHSRPDLTALLLADQEVTIAGAQSFADLFLDAAFPSSMNLRNWAAWRD